MLSILLLWLVLSFVASLLFWAACVVSGRTDREMNEVILDKSELIAAIQADIDDDLRTIAEIVLSLLLLTPAELNEVARRFVETGPAQANRLADALIDVLDFKK
jgi:hypothetical protein